MKKIFILFLGFCLLSVSCNMKKGLEPAEEFGECEEYKDSAVILATSNDVENFDEEYDDEDDEDVDEEELERAYREAYEKARREHMNP